MKWACIVTEKQQRIILNIKLSGKIWFADSIESTSVEQ